MKIAIISPTCPPYGGGIGKVAYEHFRGLKAEGFDVHFFTPRYKGRPQLQEEHVHYIKPLFESGNAAFVPQLGRKLKSFDVIHLHYPFFGGAEVVWRKASKIKKKGGKFIVHYHMDVIGSGMKARYFAYHQKNIMPKIIKAADVVAVTSFDYAHQSALASLYSAMPEKFVEVPNGVDDGVFVPRLDDAEFKQRIGIGNDEKMVLFVGGLDSAHYFKGVEYLLQAMGILKQQPYAWKLVVVGTGDLENQYKDMASQLRINEQTLFAGYVTDEELPRYYSAADVTVLPSIDKSEAFGMVLVESMAAGTPVVASHLPGVRSVVDDGYIGLLCEVKNPRDISEKINIVLSDAVSAQQMGQRGRNKAVVKYSWRSIVQQLIYLYKQ